MCVLGTKYRYIIQLHLAIYETGISMCSFPKVPHTNIASIPPASILCLHSATFISGCLIKCVYIYISCTQPCSTRALLLLLLFLASSMPLIYCSNKQLCIYFNISCAFTRFVRLLLLLVLSAVLFLSFVHCFFGFSVLRMNFPAVE